MKIIIDEEKILRIVESAMVEQLKDNKIIKSSKVVLPIIQDMDLKYETPIQIEIEVSD